MFNRRKFNSILALKGFNLDDVALAIDVSIRTLYLRLKHGDFKSSEIEKFRISFNLSDEDIESIFSVKTDNAE